LSAEGFAKRAKDDSVNATKLLRSIALSESGFVFLPTTGETFTVNEQGRIILQALQSGKSHAEIVQSLVQDYNADIATISRDLEDFITQLRRFQLVTD
jgi:hypothetical protein